MHSRFFFSSSRLTRNPDVRIFRQLSFTFRLIPKSIILILACCRARLPTYLFKDRPRTSRLNFEIPCPKKYIIFLSKVYAVVSYCKLLSMEAAFVQQGKCISSPLRLWTHRTSPLVVSRFSILVRNQRKNARLHQFRSVSSASNSDTLLSGRVGEEKKRSKDVVASNKGDEYGDLKSWMHKNGLPPCKVVLRDRPSHDAKHSPIHYVAASEDLQVNKL